MNGPVQGIRFYYAPAGASVYPHASAFFPLEQTLQYKRTEGTGELTTGSRANSTGTWPAGVLGDGAHGSIQDFLGETAYLGPVPLDQIPPCRWPKNFRVFGKRAKAPGKSARFKFLGSRPDVPLVERFVLHAIRPNYKPALSVALRGDTTRDEATSLKLGLGGIVTNASVIGSVALSGRTVVTYIGEVAFATVTLTGVRAASPVDVHVAIGATANSLFETERDIGLGGQSQQPKHSQKLALTAVTTGGVIGEPIIELTAEVVGPSSPPPTPGTNCDAAPEVSLPFSGNYTVGSMASNWFKFAASASTQYHVKLVMNGPNNPSGTVFSGSSCGSKSPIGFINSLALCTAFTPGATNIFVEIQGSLMGDANYDIEIATGACP